MTQGEAVATARRRAGRGRRIGLLLGLAAILPALGCGVPTSASSSVTAPVGVLDEGRLAAPGPPALALAEPETFRQHGAAQGRSGGAVPAGTTVFDDDVPGVGNLDPALLLALRRAAAAALDEGVGLRVTSGWRSWAYQERLLQQATAKYGSRTAAARWVATPEKSAHVSGAAVDLGPSRATHWLSAHGAEYGLCQIYRNEPWHYELRPEAVDSGCPAQYADAAHDPRLQP